MLSSWVGRREVIILLEARAPSLMILVLAVVRVPNVLLNNKGEVEVTRVDEVGLHNLSKEVGVVMALVVGVVECHNSSMVEDLLNTKVEEGEVLLSKEVVGDMVAVEVVVAVVEDLLLVDHPDHLFPSCTKQPNLCKLR